PAQAAGRGGANPFLGRMDADTAYAFANLQRMPDDVIDRLWKVNDAGAEGSRQVFETLAEDENVTPEMRALYEELSRISTREGWESAGLHANPYYAIHGASMMPMMHLELADGDAFAGFIARIEASLEKPLARRDVEGEQVLWLGVEQGLGLAIHHDDEAVTAALVPDDAAMLARVAGGYAPVEPMQAGTLAEFFDQAGFASGSGGYIDWRRVVDQVLAEDSAIAALDEHGGAEALRSEPACVAEFRALAETLPRMILGYTQINAQATEFLLRQEMSPDLGARLAPVARAPVAVDRELDGLFNVGLAIDLVAGREFARSLVDGWIENPPQCAAFSEIANNAPAWKESLSRPIPPVVTNLHGLFLDADSLEIGDGALPTGGGTLSLYMNNPQLLVGMAQMFSPAVAELKLEPGGEPVKVPPGTIPQLEQAELEAWLAMAESALGIAIGAEHVDALSKSVRATAVDDLLLAAKMDFRILETLLDFSESTLSDIEGVDAEQALAAQRAQYRAMAEAYEKGDFRLRLGESGVEITGRTTFR
ncbi:MAG: hypothetical protein RQ847_12510, partial [Wenzhouxiangellaceae bacterium]|nr:hypothetical protein [Wenzhouxiangellaceae bacterium]